LTSTDGSLLKRESFISQGEGIAVNPYLYDRGSSGPGTPSRILGGKSQIGGEGGEESKEIEKEAASGRASHA